ncbi:dihydroorotase [Hydrogenobaculum acidophilum]
MNSILIKSARLIEPDLNIDKVVDILIKDEKIEKISEHIDENISDIIDAKGLIACSSFVDLHAHLRDPGFTYKEDLGSGMKAAVFGGFTTIVCMPNTNPPIDNESVISYILLKAEKIGICDVKVSACVTKNRAGKELTDFYKLKKAGAVCFTDDGAPVQDQNIMLKALEISALVDSFVANHCEDDAFVKEGAFDEGAFSSVYGLPFRPSYAEEVMIARDATLSYHTGGRLHIQHISSALSIDIIKFFKEKGANITCEVNPNHLALNSFAAFKKKTLLKVNPPIRDYKTQEALINALKEGVIDCIATDHAPHAKHEKKHPIKGAAGMLGFQVALPIMMSLVKDGIMDIKNLIKLMSKNPAKIIGFNNTIKEGALANLVLWHPNHEWVFDENINPSKSSNSPFLNSILTSKVFYTIYKGKIVYKYLG